MGSVLAAVAALAAAFLHGRAAQAQPQTVYSLPDATFAAFAQDRQYMAWFTPRRRGCNAVHLLNRADGLRVSLPSQRAPNVTCQFASTPGQPVTLALAGTRALWTLPETSPLPLQYLLGAAADDQAERRFQEVAHTARGVGQWLGGVAGDGPTLVYALTTVDYKDETDCLAGTGPCTLVRSGGGVFRVSGRQSVRIPNTGPAVEVAAAGTSVAYVPTSGIAANGKPQAGADLPVTIVAADTGEQLAAVVPEGVPVAIALSPHVLATLERGPLGLRLAWYDAATGHPLGSVPVPKATAPALTASDQLIVFRVGRSIRAVDVTSHRLRTLTRAAATPVGLSLDGGWLRWAENLPHLARIRALYVSGRA